jgi:hypothetical protein
MISSTCFLVELVFFIKVPSVVFFRSWLALGILLLIAFTICVFLLRKPLFFGSRGVDVLYAKKGGCVNLMGLNRCRLKRLTG